MQDNNSPPGGERRLTKRSPGGIQMRRQNKQQNPHSTGATRRKEGSKMKTKIFKRYTAILLALIFSLSAFSFSASALEKVPDDISVAVSGQGIVPMVMYGVWLTNVSLGNSIVSWNINPYSISVTGTS
ncbi:MAG: hypothetical protein LBS90_09120, partial [Oscillospiraceae bacterium]|nr:hypothetical protein [Oscillospiraceae bacterium]